MRRKRSEWSFFSYDAFATPQRSIAFGWRKRRFGRDHRVGTAIPSRIRATERAVFGSRHRRAVPALVWVCVLTLLERCGWRAYNVSRMSWSTVSARMPNFRWQYTLLGPRTARLSIACGPCSNADRGGGWRMEPRPHVELVDPNPVDFLFDDLESKARPGRDY